MAKSKASSTDGGPNSRRSVGRPTKLSPEIVDKICGALQAGNYIETAAAYAGVHKDTIYDWLRRGAFDRSGPYAEFSDAIERAMSTAEVRAVAVIAKAATEQWQAAAWHLERKFPDRWGRKSRDVVEVSGPNGSPLSGLTTEELRAFVLAKRGG